MRERAVESGATLQYVLGMTQNRFVSVFVRGVIITGAMLSLSSASAGELSARLLVNGVHHHHAHVEPAAPAVWEIEFTDSESGERVTDFQHMHMKPMHLVVIREDLSTFGHVHPTYDMSTGLFTIPVHLPVRNPDNQDSLRLLPEDGRYFVFAEVKSQTHGMRTFRFELNSGRSGAVRPVESDPLTRTGEVVKYFDESGKIAAEGAPYRLRFSIERNAGCGGELLKFVYLIQTRETDGTYADARNLEPWLMMGGHALIVSERGARAPEKTYLHLHSELPTEAANYVFSHFNRGKLGAGVYKMWAQFKHQGRVLTFPVVFRFDPAHPADC